MAGLMADNLIRQSQIVGAFGPGSMLDLPDRSVMIAGLNLWSSDTSSAGWRPVSEPRLQAYLEQILGIPRLELRSPPVHDQGSWGRNRAIGPHVVAMVFPHWFVCDQVEEAGAGLKRRRLVRWADLDPSNRNQFRDGPGKPRPVTPIRFVAACDRGHIQDVDWRWLLHRGEKCAAPLYMEERGTSGDTRDTAIVCGCGKRFVLSDAYVPTQGAGGPLGPCQGHRPWLGEGYREGCDKPLKLLNRTASNAYFSQTASVISIPPARDALTQLVEKYYESLRKAPSPAIIAIYRDANPALAADLQPYTDQEVFDATARFGAGGGVSANAKPREIEFELLSSGADKIGEDTPEARLFAVTVDRDTWDPDREQSLRGLLRVVAVHRLREVTCQYAFSRFESPMSAADAGVEDHALAVDLARIAEPIRWLPAIEQFGEGLFIQFEPIVLQTWLARQAVKARSDRLERGHSKWAATRYPGKTAPVFKGAAYYMAHSLSHALMAEIALECGYPQSALKERIYAVGGGLGLLIYTAAGDAEGTLGGLVGLAGEIGDLMIRALGRAQLCSSDPTCSDHDPALPEDDRPLHGAACHGCLLGAETSCEARNDYLDRGLLVEGLANDGAAFFTATSIDKGVG
jgi:hypothetical protein